MSHEYWDTVQDDYAKLIIVGTERCLESKLQNWREGRCTPSSGIYIIRASDGDIIYVGESSDILKRFETHGTVTYFSAVRRNLGTDILGFTLQTRNGKKRYFEQGEDRSVTEFLMGCSIAFFPVSVGRIEVEEHLIKQLQPILNRKSKK